MLPITRCWIIWNQKVKVFFIRWSLSPGDAGRVVSEFQFFTFWEQFKVKNAILRKKNLLIYYCKIKEISKFEKKLRSVTSQIRYRNSVQNFKRFGELIMIMWDTDFEVLNPKKIGINRTEASFMVLPYTESSMLWCLKFCACLREFCLFFSSRFRSVCHAHSWAAWYTTDSHVLHEG